MEFGNVPRFTGPLEMGVHAPEFLDGGETADFFDGAIIVLDLGAGCPMHEPTRPNREE